MIFSELQYQVMKRITLGRSNREIAVELLYSESYIENIAGEVANILGVESWITNSNRRVRLAALAVERFGLTTDTLAGDGHRVDTLTRAERQKGLQQADAIQSEVRSN